MTRPLAPALLLLFALPPLLAAPIRPAAALAPATEKVNCLKGESVNKALAKQPGAAALVVEISGVCHENVVVTRDRVTLRGADPDDDGIQAAASVEQTDAAVWVRGAQLVNIENLKLTGGFSGLLATDVGVPFLRLRNCRLEGNNQWGAQLEVALLDAVDTTFGPNTRFSVGVFAGSRFGCNGCTLTLAPTSTALDNIVALGGSQVLLFETALVNGGINAGNSSVSLTDSSVQAFPGALGIIASVSSNIGLARSQVEGSMRFMTGTTANLFGVTQTPGTPSTPNVADDMSYVKVGAAAPACPSPPCAPAPPVNSNVLGFNLFNFSNLSLLGASQVTGSFNCSLGANAVCPSPANISGTANCGLCTKP
ncbi:MAG: hypothetical protein LC795_13955 [Acidobacteria bacterium]|nr:hypothetical protein [Acidobacteriota bacterium]MCA1620383.1 hypothetical protein [Acidobacteriota bacterium]